MLKKNALYLELNTFFIFIKNENGAILLSFVLLLPIIMGVLFLSFEISHFIQKKARLSDAIEQATLALTIDNDQPPDGDDEKIARNNKLVTSYANAYLPSETFSIPHIDITSHSDHNKYQVDIVMNYPIIILNKLFKTFPSEIKANDNAMAIKYTSARSTPTDVVFVADYSGSMTLKFDKDQGSETKIQALRRIFKDFHQKIQHNDIVDVIGFVPFSWGSKIKPYDMDNNSPEALFCHFPFVPKKFRPDSNYLHQYTFSGLKQFSGLENLDLVDNIKYGECDDESYEIIKKNIKTKTETSVLKNAYKHLDRSCYIKYFDTIAEIIDDNIDYSQTMESIDSDNKTIDILMPSVLNNDICLGNSNAHIYTQSNNISEDNSEVLNATAGGETLISAGILAGNKLFDKNNNHNKLMIILSDGDDTIIAKRKYFISEKLINMGMCERIKANDIKMVFIAIGYRPDNRIDWKECVGEENFYLAENAHRLELAINQALVVNDTEVGRNIPKS
ncbi:putative fimbrial anchor [Yersinia frederiksenii]|nr:putative fimbrial anchor [Yersinia frederiksenii]